MKAYVLTWGTRGDFQPYLALSKRLVQEGHEVHLGAPPNAGFAEMAEANGVNFVPLGNALESETILELREDMAGVTDGVKLIAYVMHKLLVPMLPQMYETSLEVGRSADVIISHFPQPAGRMAAEKLGKPFVSCMYDPNLIETKYRPPAGLPNLGRFLNPLMWKIAKVYLNSAWAGGINEVRRSVGMEPVRDLVKDAFLSRRLNLISMSTRLMEPAPDFPKRCKMTGFWYLPTEDWTPPTEVADFVERGPKPIAISFGSVPITVPATDSVGLTKILIRGVEKAGVRAIIESGGAKLGGVPTPPSVMMFKDVPHAWLFPRVAAIIHHGGAGTTAAALRSGVPSVIVPDLLDQPFWADLTFRLGVSPAPVDRGRLKASQLAPAIIEAVTNPEIARKAAALGAALCEEDGTGDAVRHIERVVAKSCERALAGVR